MRLDDSGTIGAIPYAVILLIVFGLALITLGPVVDEFIIADNGMMTENLPYSEQRGDTVQFLLMCWRALAFVGVFCVVIFLLMNGSQESTGGI